MDSLYFAPELAMPGDATHHAVRLYVEKELPNPIQHRRIICFAETVIAVLEKIHRAKRLGFTRGETGACQLGQSQTQLKVARKYTLADPKAASPIFPGGNNI